VLLMLYSYILLAVIVKLYSMIPALLLFATVLGILTKKHFRALLNIKPGLGEKAI